MMILFVISCSIYATAQTDYYYYKGKKIPLTLNDKKVCVSMSKDNKDVSERIRANFKVLSKIKDENYEIFILLQSDVEKLITSNSWKEDVKSIIITPSYTTTEKIETFSSPYLNVRLKREQDVGLLNTYAEMYGLKIIKNDPLMPLWYILSITPNCGKNPLECANTLWESGDFAASVPDFCSNDRTCSNDPKFFLQWGLHNSSYPDMDISVDSAWHYATGKNIKIAILDTGVDMDHKDLSANISDLCYDTETDSSQSFIYGPHGTLCAGIAAAVKDNGKLIAGVAPDATIVPISNNMNDTTTNGHLNRARGITWAYQHGVDIISNSWSSGTYNSAIDEAIYNAFRCGRQGKGCIVVFASGNQYSSSIRFPANCNDTILAVGAIDSTGTRAPFSNYGTGLDLVAPGVGILSTIPNDTVGYDSGTSMACPHVAGVAALVLERNSELTVNQVNSIICRNAKKKPDIIFDVPKPYGLWNNKYGYGLVDAYNAVTHTPDTVYIQNDSITGTRIISAGSVYVGRNVTDTKPYGDVIFDQGDIKLKAGYVEIKNSTTVSLGTTLTIEN